MKVEVVAIPGKGQGLRAIADIAADEMVETCPALLVAKPEGKREEECIGEPWDNSFPWSATHWCIAIGLASFVNHSYDPNCCWWVDRRAKTVNMRAFRAIDAGDEVTIDYCFTAEPWFEVK